MSSSKPRPAPASSPPASSSCPANLVGSRVYLIIPCREGTISGMERREDQELSLIMFEGPGVVSSGKIYHLETTGGLKFQGIVDIDEASTRATVLVKDDAVWSCRCCTDIGVPSPPFSSSIEGMTVRFSESDPHTIEATVLEVEKRPTLSVVLLQMTSLPPYSARIGDRIILRSGLNTWEATVVYFGDHNTRLDEVFGVTSLESRICIHVLDEHVPQEPRCFPYTTILVRPAQSGPSNWTIGHGGKGVSQRKRRSSAHEENEANQKKIKVAINGYRDTGRALARVALYSEDVDLVAINDPSITDQVSCMFRDSKCDFEVKSSSSGILSFGKKEVRFFKESDPSAVLWYMARTKLVVTSSNSSQAEEKFCKEYASWYSQTSDHKLAGPLEMILGTSTTPRNSWAPVLNIRPISQRDAKAVSDCSPLWKGKRLVSVVHFQGVDVIFELDEYPKYDVLPTSTEPSIDFTQLVRWCFHMLSRIPTAVCDVEISERSRYFV